MCVTQISRQAGPVTTLNSILVFDWVSAQDYAYTRDYRMMMMMIMIKMMMMMTTTTTTTTTMMMMMMMMMDGYPCTLRAR